MERWWNLECGCAEISKDYYGTLPQAIKLAHKIVCPCWHTNIWADNDLVGTTMDGKVEVKDKWETYL